MIAISKSCEKFLFVLLLISSYACLYLEFHKTRCLKPFVEIGGKCYFFSTNKPLSYDYYKLNYNGRVFSVPAMLDWMQASFACETLDAKARMVSIETAQEMYDLADYMDQFAHSSTHPVFWSAGHRGNLAHNSFDIETMHDFYWHDAPHPMNFTNFADTGTRRNRLPTGFCVYLEFTGTELIMGLAHCSHKLAFACELQPLI